YKLPFNEPGVHFHFVDIVAYNSVSGKVCVANPDRVPLPHGTGTPDWYASSYVVSALLVAMIEVHPVVPPAPSPDVDAAIAAIHPAQTSLDTALHALQPESR